MSETQLTPRQNFILSILQEEKGIGRAEIERQIKNLYPASKPTIARDLASLVKKRLVRTRGRSIATVYLPYEKNPLLNYLDLESYFSLEPDQRAGTKGVFDFSVFKYLSGVMTKLYGRETEYTGVRRDGIQVGLLRLLAA